MKDILVTAGIGFIGSHFVDHILSNSQSTQVTIVDIARDKKRSLKTLRFLQDKHGKTRIKFKRIDITVAKQVENIFREQQFDTVVHFAAIVSNLEALSNPYLAYQTNVNGTRIVFENSLRYGVKTFYHQSTCEVYGNHKHESAGFTPQSPLLGHSPYNISKAQADMYILGSLNKIHMRVIIGRPCNTYGPRQHPHAAISSFIRNALDSNPLVITGTGKQKREWLYVEDLCIAIEKLLLNKTGRGIYNIGTGEEISIKEVAQSVKRIVRELKLGTTKISYVKARLEDDDGYLLDSSIIKGEPLNWRPKTSFEEGLRSTILWYSLNKK
jgi:dTDP-glucose 4,6-dehydratase